MKNTHVISFIFLCTTRSHGFKFVYLKSFEIKYKENMEAAYDRIEVFHVSELPTNVTNNFTSSHYCSNRQRNNKFAIMCEFFWEKVSTRIILQINFISSNHYKKDLFHNKANADTTYIFCSKNGCAIRDKQQPRL